VRPFLLVMLGVNPPLKRGQKLTQTNCGCFATLPRGELLAGSSYLFHEIGDHHPCTIHPTGKLDERERVENCRSEASESSRRHHRSPTTERVSEGDTHSASNNEAQRDVHWNLPCPIDDRLADNATNPGQ